MRTMTKVSDDGNGALSHVSDVRYIAVHAQSSLEESHGKLLEGQYRKLAV